MLNRAGEMYLKNKKLFILMFVLLSSSVLSKTELSEEKILNKLKSIDSLSLSEFIEKMEQISSETGQLVKLQEERCSGDYTSFIIDASGERKFQKIKLTTAEKRLCKYKLINFQISVAQITFKAREKFLKESHKNQLEQLKALSRKRLSELELAAQKFK